MTGAAVRGEGWYLARDARSQKAEVAALVQAARETRDFGAVSALIELMHLVRHARARLPLIRALGACHGMVSAIPALEGELDDPDETVVSEALEAIGRVGLPYGGAVVARWLSDQDRDAISPRCHAAALLALSRVGHRAAGPRVEEAAAADAVPPAHVHLCLATAVEARCLVEARERVVAGGQDADVARAAVLHLAAVEDSALPALLGPLAAGTEPELAALAHTLLAGSPQDTESLLLSLFDPDAPPAGLSRRARTLRARPFDEVLETLDLLSDCMDPATDQGRRALATLMAAGVPALQDLALERAAQGPSRTLARVLGRAHSATPVLAAGLPGWRAHEDDRVSAAAIRATVNVGGPQALDTLHPLSAARRPVQRLEWVRACQNAWRDRRDADGRSTLGHSDRRDLEQRLRALLREDPDTGVRRLALYAVGNLGLTGLAADLARVLRSSEETGLRQAAAASLGEFAATGQLPALAEALAEEEAEVVRFRIARALLRALPQADRVDEGLVATVRARRCAGGPRDRVLLTGLLGMCGDEADVPALLREVAEGPHPVACAALTALGRLGAPGGLPVLLASLEHAEPERRLRAAEALGGLRQAADAGLSDDDHDAVAVALAARLSDVAEPDDVRAAACAALAAAPLPEAGQQALIPPGAGDPFLVDVLQLRLGQEAADAEVVDARLAEAIPGFDPAAFGQRCPDALQALRTAEYFSLPGVTLPAGLDAATPVIFWVKGLELWLHDRLGPIQREVAGGPVARTLDAIAEDWGGMRTALAPGWDPHRLPGSAAAWHGLARGAARALRHRRSRDAVLSLNIAACLLLAGAEASAAKGIGPWSVGLSREEVVRLANDLAALAQRRNELTHQVAASGEHRSAVRRVALACARGVLRLRV